jgi:hypothetical protein
MTGSARLPASDDFLISVNKEASELNINVRRARLSVAATNISRFDFRNFLQLID